MSRKLVLPKTAHLALAGLLLVSLLLRLLYLAYEGFNYDEGTQLMFGTLAAQGHTPYTETFAGIPPFALVTIELGLLLFGPTLAVRLPMLLYSLVGVVAMFILVRRQTSTWPSLTAFLAAAFLSFGPNYFAPSVSILAEVPALALALLSVALIQLFQERSHFIWLLLSGVAFALSLCLKIYVLFVPIIVGLQLLGIAATRQNTGLTQPATWVTVLKLEAVWLSGVGATLGMWLFVYDPVEMYRQVIEFRLLLRDTFATAEHGFANSSRVIGAEALRVLPLLASAGLSLFVLKRRELVRVWLWGVWFFLALIIILGHIPLRPRHTVIILPPLAALSSISLTSLVNGLPHALQPHVNRILGLGVALSLTVILIYPLNAFLASASINQDLEQPLRQTAIHFVGGITQPSDCLVVDDQRFALEAKRLVPPYLSETSEARLRVGWLPPDQIARTAASHHCPVLVIETFRFRTAKLHEAVRQVYALRLDFKDLHDSNRITIYAVNTHNTQTPVQPRLDIFDRLIRLTGIDQSIRFASPGSPVTLSFYWEAEQRPKKDYKIFLHLKDSQGNVVASYDRYPFQFDPALPLDNTSLHPKYTADLVAAEVFHVYPSTGYLPTRLWIPGDTLKDTFTISLPDSLPAGSYTFSAGLYDESTLERLPLNDAAHPENAVQFGQLELRLP